MLPELYLMWRKVCYIYRTRGLSSMSWYLLFLNWSAIQWCVFSISNFALTWKVAPSSFLSRRSLGMNVITMDQALEFNFDQNFFSLVFQICTKARMWRVCVCCDLDSSWTKQRGNCGRISSEAIYGKDPQLLSSYSLRGRRSKGRGEEDTVSGIGGWRKKTISSDIFWSCFSPPPQPPPFFSSFLLYITLGSLLPRLVKFQSLTPVVLIATLKRS